MPNRNKERGDRFQRAVLTATLEHFGDAWITRAGWDDDRGDIVTNADDPRFIVQAKDCAKKQWRPWLEELDQQITNAGAKAGVLAIKQRGIADAGQSLAVMQFRDWLALAALAARHPT